MLPAVFVVPLASWVACRRVRAASSEGRLRVWNCEQVWDSKTRIAWPSLFVECSSPCIVVSVCKCNFAKPCHVTSSNNSIRTTLSWEGLSKPSKTGIAHYRRWSESAKQGWITVSKHTCNKSLKSRPANFFIALAFLLNRHIVCHPNVGTSRYLDHIIPI